MLPRLVFAVLFLALAGGAGFGIYKLASRRTAPSLDSLMTDNPSPAASQVTLRQLLRADPRNAQAHVLLGQVDLDLNDAVAAEKEFKAARSLRYDKATLIPLLARSYMMQGHYADVLADMPSVTAAPEERLPNLLARSQAFLALGDLGQSGLALEAARQLAPNDEQVLLGLGRLALARGHAAGAIGLAGQVLTQRPDQIDALMLQSDAMFKGGDVEAALRVSGRTIETSPSFVPARLQRARLLMSSGRDKQAQEDVDAVLKIDRRNSEGLVLNAMLLIRSGKYGDALTEFQKMGSALEEVPRGYYYQALAMSMQDQTLAALDVVLRFRRYYPGDAEGALLEASLDLRVGQPQKAIEALTQTAPVLNGPAHDLLGRAYFMVGATSEAIAHYRAAAAMEPGNADYASHLSAAEQFGGGASR